MIEDKSSIYVETRTAQTSWVKRATILETSSTDGQTSSVLISRNWVGKIIKTSTSKSKNRITNTK